MLLLPVPDYSFRSNLWKELILSKGGLITKHDSFDVSSLAKVSEGYPSGHIVKTIGKVTFLLFRICFLKIRKVDKVFDTLRHLAVNLCIRSKCLSSLSIEATMTERRILQQKMRPLQPVEFIAHLAKFEPIYREEADAYQAWVCNSKICILYTKEATVTPISKGNFNR